MKRHLVQGLALLLMVGALYGQGSQSTSQPAGGQHSHDQMQMPSTQGQTTDQNAPPAQNQQIPGMQMLDNLYHHKPSSLEADWSKDSYAPIPSFVDTGSALIDKSNVDSFIQAGKNLASPK